MHPLNFRAQLSKDVAGTLGCAFEIILAEFSSPRHFSFDNKLRYGHSPLIRTANSASCFRLVRVHKFEMRGMPKKKRARKHWMSQDRATPTLSQRALM